MTADAYTSGLLSKDLPTELTRLRLLEKSYDPGTVRILEQLDLPATARCLEVGAGAGSIAHWLSDRMPRGSVVAADLDPRFIECGGRPNLTVQRLDITEADFAPGSFDLIHARAVFMHLPRRAEMVEQVVRWLAPGGWLVLEDVYFLPAEDSPYPVWRRSSEAWHSALRAQGIDLSWARRAPAAIAAAGLTSVGISVTPGGLGVDPVQDELLRIRLVQSGQRLAGAGLTTADEVEQAIELLASGPAPDVSTFVYSSWGQRPG